MLRSTISWPYFGPPRYWKFYSGGILRLSWEVPNTENAGFSHPFHANRGLFRCFSSQFKAKPCETWASEVARSYAQRFCAPRWERVAFMVFDFDSMPQPQSGLLSALEMRSDNDFMGKLVARHELKKMLRQGVFEPFSCVKRAEKSRKELRT